MPYESVVVAATRTGDLKVERKVGESTETIRVPTQPEVLETSTNTLSSTISPEGIAVKERDSCVA
jgi:hypothetical protein